MSHRHCWGAGRACRVPGDGRQSVGGGAASVHGTRGSVHGTHKCVLQVCMILAGVSKNESRSIIRGLGMQLVLHLEGFDDPAQKLCALTGALFW